MSQTHTQHIRQFLTSQSGAVTVDWTVLAAAVVGLGVATVGAVRTGTGSLASDINAALSGASVAALGELGSGVTAAAAYVRELLVYDEAFYEQIVDMYRAYTDEKLLEEYALYSAPLAPQLESGNSNVFTPGALDASAARYSVITERGLDLPDGSPTIEELDALYAATL